MTGTTIPGDLTPTPLSGYPLAASVGAADLIFISQDGVSKRATIAQALAGSGSAPVAATYFVLSSNPDLTSERVLQFNATQFSYVDNGAGLTYVVSLNFTSAATPLADAAAAAVGSSIVPARSDHQHPLNVTGTAPVPVSGTAGAGSSVYYARSDHNHGAPPAFTGASAGVDGTLGGVTKPLAGQQDYFLRADGSWAIAAGTGTVTSVGLALPVEFTVTNSPVTTSGTLTGAWASALANRVFASPNGAPGTPAFRALVAADIPNLPASIITSGQLAIAVGGTSASTAQGARLALLPSIVGNANKALTVNAGETDFTYTALTTGTVTSVGLAGTTAEITVTGVTPITSSGSWTLSLPSALTFTGKTITGGAYTGGTWNNGIIGGSTAAAGTFTALTATGAVALSPANANVVISPTGTGLVTINPATAGSLDNVVIGASTPLAITGTLVTGNAFVPNSSTIPTNGLYLPSSNTPAIAANSKRMAEFNAPSGNNYQRFSASSIPLVFPGGPGADIEQDISSKGTASVRFYTSSQSIKGFEVAHTASGVNYLQVNSGASGTGPTISAQGAGTDLDVRLTPKGAGYAYVTATGIKFPDLTTQTTAATSGLSLAQVQAAAVSL